MAFVYSHFGFDQRGIDLNLLVRFGESSAFYDNINLPFRGRTYQDIIEVVWFDGFDFYVSEFGGQNFQLDGVGNVVGGIVTGYAEFVFDGFEYIETSGFLDISVSAARIYNATLTRSTGDDANIIKDALSGRDIFSLSFFSDFANGFGGNDVVRGLGGADTLLGGGGNDQLLGGGGSDRLLGGVGRDNLSGSTGNDRLFGGGDNDRILGGGGRDNLVGGGGADILNGGAGNDTLSGGLGPDRFIFSPRDGKDVVRGFQDGIDEIGIGGPVNRFRDLEISQAGSDAVIEFSRTTIVLKNTDADDLSAADFFFV